VRLGGILWILAGLTCTLLLIFVFIGERLENLGLLLEEPILPALVASGAIVGLTIGLLLIARPGPGVVRRSNIAGITWLIAFGSVVLTRLDEPGPRFSSSLITVLGVVGALVAYVFGPRRTG
jgi:hypothetical protein